MLEVAVAQLRLATSLVFGARLSIWSLDRLVNAAIETWKEFGAIDPVEAELLGSVPLDDASRRDIEAKRFRAQATRAGRDTPYYRDLFHRLAVEPTRLRRADVTRIPVTTKTALRAAPDAFVRRSAPVAFQASTTGTTGRPARVFFSSREMHAYMLLSAMSELVGGNVEPDDVVQISTSASAALGNTCFAGACARIGAMVYHHGIGEPADALARMAERRTLSGKRSRTSVLSTYPSYLGELVETGRRLGYRPADFGLERIFVGGEVVTGGLKARAQQVFGPVRFVEGYAMTETWPVSGVLCRQGHLHFEPSQGLVEVIDPISGEATRSGEAGSLVVTPFAPYRESTILLRYDTEDLVRPLEGPLSCERRYLAATTNVLGKLRHAARHRDGWTTTRDVLEALEATAAVPLPARCGFWAEDHGVAVEIVMPADTPDARRAIERRLEERGVPLTRLLVRDEPGRLERPLPVRCDLRDVRFSDTPRPAGCPARTGRSDREEP